MSSLQWLADTVNGITKHGWSLPALLISLTALFRVRKFRRKLKRFIPMLGDDESEVKEYVTNQARIESKLDALLIAGGVSWDAGSKIGKIDVNVTDGVKATSILSQAGYVLAGFTKSFTHVTEIFHLRGKRKMKNYLNKLGSRKFQAFLAVTIPNMIILFGFMLGNIDLEGKVNEWMPAINLIIQAITTATYQNAESKSDVASIKAEVNNDSYASREDSEGV